MAKNYTTGIIITGDAKGGIKAIEATEKNLKKFDKTSKNTNKTMAGLKRGVADVSKSMVGYSAAALAASAAAGVYVVHNANQIKQQKMLSDAIGVSTSQLSGLAYAFKDTQVTAEKLADILKDSSEKIGDYLVTGGGEAADVIERLGLNVNELASLSPDKQLLKIAEGLDQVGTKSEKIAILESMASDASLLLPLLENNAEGLRAAQQEAEALGVSLSDIDTSMIAQGSSDVGRLGAAFSGAGNILTAHLAPAFGAVSGAIVDTVVQQDLLRDSTSDLGEVSFDAVSTIVDNVRDASDAFEALAYKVGLVYAVLNTEVSLSTFDDIGGLFDEYNSKIDEIYKKNEDFKKGYRQSFSERINAYKLEASYQQDLIDLGFKHSEVNGETAGQIKKQNELLKQQKKEWDSILDSALKTAEESQKAMEESWAEAQENNYQTWLEKDWARQSVEFDHLEAKDRAEERAHEATLKRLEEQQAATEKMVDRLDETFVDLWRDLRTDSDNAFDFIANGFGSLLDEMMHQAFTKPIVLGFVNGTQSGGVSGGIDGAFNALSSLNSVGGFFNGGMFSGQVGGLAAGAIGSTLGYGGVAAGGQAAMLASQTAAFGTAGSSLTAGAAGASSMGLGSMAMAAAPYLAAALAIDSLTGGGISTGLFGGDWKHSATNLSLAGNADGADATTRIHQRKDGGWLRKSKGRVKVDDMSELDQALSATILSLSAGIESAATELGYQFSDAFTLTSELAVKGLSEAEIQAEINRWVTDFSNGLIGEQGAFSQLVAAFTLEGQSLSQGLDNMLSAQAAYNNAFLTEAEKRLKLEDGMNDALVEVNLTLPTTKQGYRDLVEGLDRTTESGAAAYATLMGLSTQADAYYQNLVKVSEQQMNFDGALDGLSRSIEAEKTLLTEAFETRENALTREIDIINKSVDSLGDLNRALSTTLGNIFGAGGLSHTTYTQAQAGLLGALDASRAGNMPTATSLAPYLEVVGKNSASLYSTLADFEYDQKVTGNIINDLLSVTDSALTVEEQMLGTLEDDLKFARDSYELQIQSLDAQMEYWQTEVDTLMGIDNSVLSVADAIARFEAVLIGDDPNAVGGGGLGFDLAQVSQTLGANIATAEAAPGGAGFSDESVSAWLTANSESSVTEIANAMRDHGVGYDQMARVTGMSSSEIERLYLDWVGVPAFANGGVHSGGVRLVGERGPELEITGPSRILNNSQTSNLLDNSKLIQVIEEMKSELVELKNDNRQMQIQLVKNTRDTARRVECLELWDHEDRMPGGAA